MSDGRLRLRLHELRPDDEHDRTERTQCDDTSCTSAAKAGWRDDGRACWLAGWLAAGQWEPACLGLVSVQGMAVAHAHLTAVCWTWEQLPGLHTDCERQHPTPTQPQPQPAGLAPTHAHTPAESSDYQRLRTHRENPPAARPPSSSSDTASRPSPNARRHMVTTPRSLMLHPTLTRTHLCAHRTPATDTG